MSVLNPAAWNGIGIVSFLIVFVAGFVWSLFRGWIVLGINHREIVAQRDREIDALEKRSADDAVSIGKFADAAARSVVTAEVQEAFIKAFRRAAEERT